MIRILTCKNIDEYRHELYDIGDIDAQCTDDIDYMGGYQTGHYYDKNMDTIIKGIFKHNESGSAWVVIQNHNGGMFEIDIEWSDHYGFICY